MKLEKKMYLNNFPFFILFFVFAIFIRDFRVHLQEFIQGGGLTFFYLSGGGHPLGPENLPDIHRFRWSRGG